MKLNIQIQNIKGQLKIRRLVGTQNLPLFAAHRYIETLQKNAVEKSHMCFPDVCVPTKTPCPWKDVNSASHAASVAIFKANRPVQNAALRHRRLEERIWP